PPRVSMVKTVQGRAAGQLVFAVGRDIHQGLEQRIVPQRLGVIAIGITSEDLVDSLGENGLARMGHERLRPRIRQSCGNGTDDSQFLVEPAQGQKTRIADHAATLKIHGYLLCAQVPEGKLLRTVCRHDLEPLCRYKCKNSCNLLMTGGSFFKKRVRNSG